MKDRCKRLVKQIKKDETKPEAELLDILNSRSISPGHWINEENQKFLEAYELHGWDYKKISAHVGTRSIVQVKNHR